MTEDELFERIWTTNEGGFGEAYYRDDLARLITMRAQLEAKQIPPRRVVGTGYKNPRKVAFEYLDSQIAKAREALATRGRSCFVNQSNVRVALREQQEAA